MLKFSSSVMGEFPVTSLNWQPISARWEKTPRIIAGLHRNAYLASIPHAVSGLDLHCCHPKFNRPLGWASRLWFSAETLTPRLDIVNETYFVKRRTGFHRVPIVTTVYDMIHELYTSYSGMLPMFLKLRGVRLTGRSRSFVFPSAPEGISSGYGAFRKPNFP